MLTDPRQRKLFLLAAAVLALAGAIWLAYRDAIHTPFILDDPASIENNPSIVRLWPLVGDVTARGPLNPPKDLPTSGRPLVNLTFALNYHFGKFDPTGYHVFNMVVHFLSTILVGLTVQRILRLNFFTDRFAEASSLLAFLCALLWAVHPLNSETVVYVTQRTELMVALFYFATVYAALRYWAADTRPQRNTWLAAAVLACLAGMASKEMMVTAPVIILLMERVLITSSFRQAFRRSWPLYLGLSLGWILLLALNYDRPRAGSAGFDLTVSPLVYWFTQAKILWLYLKLVVWPWPLVIHYQWSYLETLGQAWPWLLATAALTIGSLALYWRSYVAGLVGLWVLLILSPTMIVPIITEVAAERRMYLPLAAIVPLAVAGGYWLILRSTKRSPLSKRRSKAGVRSPRTDVVAISGVTFLVAVATWVLISVDINRVSAFKDPITLWQDAVIHQPEDFVAHNNLGAELMHAARPQEAIAPLQHALQLNPNHFESRINLGTSYMRVGRLPDAIAEFRQVIDRYPNSIPARCDLGIALGKLNRLPEAIEEFHAAQKIDPGNSAVDYNLGLLLARMGQMPEAIEQFQSALHSDPDYFEAHVNLGAALASSGKPQEAVEHFQKALEIKPNDCGVYFNMALAYEELNRPADAIAAANKALEEARRQKQPAITQRVEAWLQSIQNDNSNGTNSSYAKPSSPSSSGSSTPR
jgi:protein O-mannosyl-transferase